MVQGLTSAVLAGWIVAAASGLLWIGQGCGAVWRPAILRAERPVLSLAMTHTAGGIAKAEKQIAVVFKSIKAVQRKVDITEKKIDQIESDLRQADLAPGQPPYAPPLPPPPVPPLYPPPPPPPPPPSVG